MRQVRLYRTLTLFRLWAAGTGTVLVAVALVRAHVPEAAAASLCTAAFFVPGILFLIQWRRLYVRDLALAHAAKLAEEAGVTDGVDLGKRLGVAAEDAMKILRIAIREGLLRGEMDRQGRFVSATAPRCAVCGTPIPGEAPRGRCPSCGAAPAGGT